MRQHQLFSAERSDNSRIFDEELFARDRWLKIKPRIKGDVKLIFAWFIGVAPIWDILANNEGFEDKIAFIGKALPYFYTARGRLCEETIRIDLPNCMPPSRDEPYTTQMVIYGVNLRRSAAKGGEYGFKDDGRGLQPIEGLRNLQTAYREEDWQAKNLFF